MLMLCSCFTWWPTLEAMNPSCAFHYTLCTVLLASLGSHLNPISLLRILTNSQSIIRDSCGPENRSAWPWNFAVLPKLSLHRSWAAGCLRQTLVTRECLFRPLCFGRLGDFPSDWGTGGYHCEISRILATMFPYWTTCDLITNVLVNLMQNARNSCTIQVYYMWFFR